MSLADLKAALMKLAEDWDAEAQVAQSDAERETLLGAAAELRECLAEAAPAPPTPDLKADLLESLEVWGAWPGVDKLRARVKAATVTEPGQEPQTETTYAVDYGPAIAGMERRWSEMDASLSQIERRLAALERARTAQSGGTVGLDQGDGSTRVIPADAERVAQIERGGEFIKASFDTADGKRWGAVFQDLSPEFGPRFVTFVDLPAKPRPEPTNEEILDALRAGLPKDWNYANCVQPNEIMVSIQRRGVLAYVTYATLRKHGAPVVAGWLRGLAGVDQ